MIIPEVLSRSPVSRNGHWQLWRRRGQVLALSPSSGAWFRLSAAQVKIWGELSSPRSVRQLQEVLSLGQEELFSALQELYFLGMVVLQGLGAASGVKPSCFPAYSGREQPLVVIWPCPNFQELLAAESQVEEARPWRLICGRELASGQELLQALQALDKLQLRPLTLELSQVPDFSNSQFQQGWSQLWQYLQARRAVVLFTVTAAQAQRISWQKVGLASRYLLDGACSGTAQPSGLPSPSDLPKLSFAQRAARYSPPGLDLIPVLLIDKLGQLTEIVPLMHEQGWRTACLRLEWQLLSNRHSLEEIFAEIIGVFEKGSGLATPLALEPWHTAWQLIKSAHGRGIINEEPCQSGGYWPSLRCRTCQALAFCKLLHNLLSHNGVYTADQSNIIPPPSEQLTPAEQGESPLSCRDIRFIVEELLWFCSSKS